MSKDKKEAAKTQGTQETIVRFDKVSFEWGVNKSILDAVSFTIRRGMKFALMGQNGAGKSTIFGLISGKSAPESGIINVVKGVSISQKIPARLNRARLEGSPAWTERYLLLLRH